MEQVISKIFENSKGILAADESTPTMTKRFDGVRVASTILNRHIYRHLIFSTPNLENYIGGVILYDETIRNVETIQPLKDKDIVLGIKVDKGAHLFGQGSARLTEGLDGLGSRLSEYRELGAEFAKWRAVIRPGDPDSSISANAQALAVYAKKCQANNIVPIVEPEVLMDGSQDIEDSLDITSKVLCYVFHELYRQNVSLEHIILKPNMVINGYASERVNHPSQTAHHTLSCFRRFVPAAVPAVAFLSGGQDDKDAINNLAAMNEEFYLPWTMSFSFGRTLQGQSLRYFGYGKPQHSQNCMLHMSERCSLATEGEQFNSIVPPIDFNN